jgi:ferredoxin
VGKPLVRFCEGQEYNCSMDEILWHRRESRRPTENTNFVLQPREFPAYSKTQEKPEPGKLFTKRSEDGIVIITDSKQCTYCELCVQSCPYGAPKLLNETKVRIMKCDLCIDRLKEGRPPACVVACPTEALEVKPMEELITKYGELRSLEGYPDYHITKPSVIFQPMKRT